MWDFQAIVTLILSTVFGGGLISVITFFISLKYFERKSNAEVNLKEGEVETKKLDNFESWQEIYKTMFEDLKAVHVERAKLQDAKINLQNKKIEFFEKKMTAYEESLALAYSCSNSDSCPVLGKVRLHKVKDHKS